MRRRDWLKVMGVTAISAGLPARRSAAAQALRIGTLAPKSSPWGKVFEKWINAVRERSGGALELVFSYNGQQGDEDAMVGKIKSGQLEGAVITTVGLSKIYKPILALQMPGVFASFAQLDRARDALKGEFEKGAANAGFFIAGWGDVGLVRALSKGFSVTAPDDLKGKRPYFQRADVIQPAVFSVIGGVGGVPLNVPEVLPNLNTGAINVVMAPCLVAEQLQWAGKLDQLNDAPIAPMIGAIVLGSKAYNALSADAQALLADGAGAAASALTTRIRSDDDAAFGRLKGKMTVSTPSADERTKWDGVFKAARQKLAQETFSSDLVRRIEGYGK